MKLDNFATEYKVWILNEEFNVVAVSNYDAKRQARDLYLKMYPNSKIRKSVLIADAKVKKWDWSPKVY